MSTSATILCGWKSIDWEGFCPAVVTIYYKPHRQFVALKIGQLLAFDIATIQTWDYDYSTIRHECRNLKCIDERDYVYAIQGLLSTGELRLGITPDYSIEPSRLFTDVCSRIVTHSHNTRFLESCELLSISLPDLPTWVPDWSCPMHAQEHPLTQWSACGWISAQAKHLSLGSGVLRVAGIQAAKVERVYYFGDGRRDAEFQDIIEALWQFYEVGDAKPLGKPYFGGGTLLDTCLRTLNMNEFDDSWFPVNKAEPNYSQVKQELLLAWKEDGSWDWDHYFQHRLSSSEDYEADIRGGLIGRGFFCSSEGYIGLVPYGTRRGDIICVVLGCKVPIVLRRALADETQWEVVGACYVEGLMNGEAIYGVLPNHYRAVGHTGKDPRIDDYRYAILDTRTQTLKTDPAEFLDEVGIRPTRYQRDPHILEVAPEVLREAGVDLQDFDLI